MKENNILDYNPDKVPGKEFTLQKAYIYNTMIFTLLKIWEEFKELRILLNENFDQIYSRARITSIIWSYIINRFILFKNVKFKFDHEFLILWTVFFGLFTTYTWEIYEIIIRSWNIEQTNTIKNVYKTVIYLIIWSCFFYILKNLNEDISWNND